MRCAVNPLTLPGPVLVLGANGFIGSHLYRRVKGITEKTIGISSSQIDLERLGAARALILRERPRLIFNCLGYGGYPNEDRAERIFRVNLGITAEILQTLQEHLPETIYIHSGSSSEYGTHCSGPDEQGPRAPDSLYALAKFSASEVIQEFKHLRVVNLRLYSVYGPGEPQGRLIPTLLAAARKGTWPPFAAPETSRDFVHVEDVVSAFLMAATTSRENQKGKSFNIATGKKTTLKDLAELSRDLFQIKDEPEFTNYPARSWDQKNWFGNPARARNELGWEAKIDLRSGLSKVFQDPNAPASVSEMRKLAVIVACYQDAPALKELHDRLGKTLEALPVQYRLLFINDGSPDETESQLKHLSSSDSKLIGVTHSRNFGSQAAFRSGMDLLQEGEACVWMDGDLQDPPELINKFFEKWNEGYDVVFGVRETREENLILEVFRKVFYRLFRWASDAPIPLDAGDFGLLSPRATKALLGFEERELFWRGLRAFVGFRQVGVPYHRPARKYGRSTNSWLKNLEWAKRGLFSFGGKFLRGYFLLAGVVAASLTLAFLLLQAPRWTPWLVLSFGLFQLLGLALVTDYLGRIFQEVKRRPLYFRLSRIEGGEVTEWKD